MNAQLDLVMDTLGDSTRREILALLKQHAMSVGDIAEHLPISRPAVSRHLRILESAQLVEYTEEGTRNIFRIRQLGFQAAYAYLESFWDEALDSFKQAAEKSEL